MNLEEAQRDMQRAYYDGATGLIASASAWFAATLATCLSTPRAAIGVLLFGGMLIFPVSVLLSKALGRSGRHAKNNPLNSLAIAGTVWMLLAIPIAYGASLYRLEWFFPAMLMTIGGRYLTFPTLYGVRLYWICGGALAASGIVLVAIQSTSHVGALAGALIEFGFGAAIFARARANAARQSAPTDAARLAASAMNGSGST
ncbi:MAG: hypothetical protein V4582_25505 [Pseudomonadota bacterium]